MCKPAADVSMVLVDQDRTMDADFSLAQLNSFGFGVIHHRIINKDLYSMNANFNRIYIQVRKICGLQVQ